jgi:NAD(P)H-quinone oxidoreductase subunit 4L
MDYVILSLILLSIGIYGLLTKRHFLKILISIELIATAASMNFVLLASSTNKALGQAFLVLAFSTDTCVTAIVLALLIIVSRKYGTSDIRELAKLEPTEAAEDDERPEEEVEQSEAGA